MITSGPNRVDTAKAGALAGGRLEKADADFVREHTGFAIGGVPAVAHARPITVLVDRDLTAFEPRIAGLPLNLDAWIEEHRDQLRPPVGNAQIYADSHCAALDAPVFVHPWDMFGGCRLDPWMLEWTVSMPAETQLSLNRMILGGAFDQLPKDLRICFAHGGGSFTFLLGRLENAWRRREMTRGHSKHTPSTYLDRFSVDSAVADPRALRFLVEVMSPERVMLGSDYPFPLGEEHVGSLIRNAGFDAETIEKLLGRNTVTFFGLDR